MAKETKRKSLEDLREQWAGGRDAWINVPLTSNNDAKQEFLPCLVTRIQRKSSNNSRSAWPRIVQESILFGLSAYNPRGQELPLNINQERQDLLREEIEKAKCKLPITAWDALGIWEGGSFEPGFILALPCSMEKEGLALSIDLAKRHDQGAIYRFRLDDDDDSSMIRDTIGVCDPGCEAQVIIEIDTEASDAYIQELLESAT
mmetsp:Transcript_4102/g.9777  ORF Transcript_4102/g.9777 Transcript_4102/m.9777 type:complete len:203 (-) Transcript_4102:157-765(-)|eukprot:CAMPEP_0116089624 /NCGR_PEP_ID=MMETSP0327-20121206/6522_1 /TAXON_ID=44447 /ORGANISM="Pseudo-nitzschia delicatissima, Strain B596" /LENGTH=202 /DNA_ID=CAMNT_0003580823 /DNA_START=42 /DNA_END=650 /DNA_ORIENTATION=+